jgi:putative RNA 2'-phosphotransferase
MSYYLRHAPQAGGLTLDEGGWVGVAELLAALTGHGLPTSRAELDRVVAGNDKQRFAFDATGGRIRASQGHSVPVDLGLTALPPPAELYHGTVARHLPEIRAHGLRPMSRQHVHLSSTVDTASTVGARRGTPVILTVDAAALHAAGHDFFRSANGVWLTATVPPRYLREP